MAFFIDVIYMDVNIREKTEGKEDRGKRRERENRTGQQDNLSSDGLRQNHTSQMHTHTYNPIHKQILPYTGHTMSCGDGGGVVVTTSSSLIASLGMSRSSFYDHVANRQRQTKCTAAFIFLLSRTQVRWRQETRNEKDTIRLYACGGGGEDKRKRKRGGHGWMDGRRPLNWCGGTASEQSTNNNTKK